MKAKLFLLACALATIFSCKKGNDNEAVNPPAVPSGPMREVLLNLAGDITVNESPLGRKTNGIAADARTLNDSTLYIIEVGTGYSSIFKGLFNRPDSIVVRIPANLSVTFAAAAIKRGSGPGLYYTWSTSFRQFFPYPIDASLTNRMDTSYGYFRGAIDTLSDLPVFNTTDTTQISRTLHSELDSYTGQISYGAGAAPGLITIPMRRVVFGVRYNVTNFSSGKLIADFSGLMPVKYLTPSEAAYQHFIYTADELRWNDSLYYSKVPVNLKWQKPDGSIVTLGQKTIGFRRNVLTTLNVTIPAGGGTEVNPIPTDTSFTGSDNVNF